MLTNVLAETHPSQPNYLALVSSDTYGVTHNNEVNLNAQPVGDLLEATGKSWKIGSILHGMLANSFHVYLFLRII